MATLFTLLNNVGLTNLLQTLTHSLSRTAAALQAIVIANQTAVTLTAPTVVGSIGTNLITVGVGVDTLQTCDVYIWEQHSLMQ